MKDKNGPEQVIEDFLSNESASLSEEFTESLLVDIKKLNSENKSTNRGVSYFIPFVSFGVVFCALFFFTPLFDLEVTVNEKDDIALESNSLPSYLHEPEKIIIEDLMAIPQELNVSESFLSEQTYDLLVLLDS
ncbi:MAG: hypothetical protein P8P49_05060 [Opitutales bacterium]|nr:hypothetical protein [Opitutales bacterium]